MMPADHNQQGAPHSWSDCMKFRCSRAARCYMHKHQPSSSTSGLQAIRTALHESRMPCCADLLVLQLVELSSFLNSHSVPHAIIWGALLGALRSEDTIPWTADGDVAVPAWGIHRLIEKPWNEQLAQRGYLIMGEKQADAMGRMCINRWHPELEDLHDPFLDNGHQNGYINSFVYVDIYAAAKVESSPPVMLLTPFKLKMSHQQYSCHEVGECLVSRADEWEPLRSCTLRGYKFPCPAHAERVLVRMYGATWWTPARCLITRVNGCLVAATVTVTMSLPHSR